MRRIISKVSVNCTVLSLCGVCRSDENESEEGGAEGLARNENRWENKAGGGRSRRRGGADGTERGNIVVVAPVSCRPCTVYCAHWLICAGSVLACVCVCALSTSCRLLLLILVCHTCYFKGVWHLKYNSWNCKQLLFKLRFYRVFLYRFFFFYYFKKKVFYYYETFTSLSGFCKSWN